MKIYKDKDLTEEIIGKEIDLGEVPAGETKRFNFWVLNDSKAYLRKLNFVISHSEVSIIEAPEELDKHGVGELILEWTPSVTLKEGLKAPLIIKGEEVWG